MSLFEFLMVLVSIIVGLGIAEVLTGVARQIRCRQSITGYWVHSTAVAVVFFALLQQWWEAWGLRMMPEWTFFSLLMMLAGPAGLFLIAHLLFPEPMESANFRDYYHGAIRPLALLAAATVLVATLFRPLVFGWDLLVTDNATSLVFLLCFLVLAASRRPAVHAGIWPVLLFFVLLDILNWSYALSSN